MKSTVVSLLGNLSVKPALCVSVMTFVAPASTRAQLLSFSKQDLVDYTAQAPFDRLPDGRPKVPNDLLERARELSGPPTQLPSAMSC
jgi:hypothetical protein